MGPNITVSGVSSLWTYTEYLINTTYMDKKTFDYFLSGDSEIDFVIQKFDINIAGILHINVKS